MWQEASFTLNRKTVLIPTDNTHQTLLEYLRSCALTGTKEGCGDGDCGACTVAIVGQDAQGNAQYQAVNSCLIPLSSVINKEILTVEGLANDKLHPVQDALIKTGGSQCGYCTPGFVMSMFAGYYSGELNDLTIEGNLCRCTGYVPIREAVESLGKPESDDSFVLAKGVEGRKKKEEGRLDLQPTTHNPQSYYHPKDLVELFAHMEAVPEAPLIAGGTDLGLELSNHSRSFYSLISLENVAELKVIYNAADSLEIGAAVPLTHIEKSLHGIFPALDEMIHWFAARQIRNRATLGGNIGTASPIGDLPPVLLALDASVKLANRSGERIVPLADFFTAYRQTVRKADEVIVSVIIPKGLSEGSSQRLSFSYKVGKRGTDDISIVAAAFTVDLDDGNTVKHARLAYGGVAATPVRAKEVETWLLGKAWSEATILEAKTQLRNAFRPLSDFRGSADYRNRLVANLFEKFFVQFASKELSA